MTTSAFISGTTIKTGDAASPEVFTTLEEAFSISGLGQTNALVESTHYGSSGVREYISGLADGTEITIECNLVSGSTTQTALVTDITNKLSSRNMQIEITDGTTAKTYDFAVVPLSWERRPSVDDKNVIAFNLKITGAITES